MDQDNTGTENPIAPAGASTPNENAINTTPETTVEPVTPPQAQPTTPLQPENKPKSNNALKVTTAICVILALAGIGTSIYFAMDSNNKSSHISDLQSKQNLDTKETDANPFEVEENNNTIATESATQTTIDNSLAQNLIDPYVKSLSYNNTIFRNEFNEDTKALVSYVNINPLSIEETLIPYYSLNDEYQSLFGNSTSLEQRTFSLSNGTSLALIPNTNRFQINKSAGGGTGGSLFAIVKQAVLSGNTITVDVYSDTIPWCDPQLGNNDGYCYDGEYKGTVTLNDGNMSSIITNQSNRIPVYQMQFTKDTAHYVLTGIQKP